MVARVYLVLAVVGALALVGCGGAVRWDSGQPGVTNAPVGRPLTGPYYGRLRGDDGEATLSLQMRSVTAAVAVVRIGEQRIDLTGTMLDSTRLRLTGGGMTIDGGFRGAYHPQDSSYYEPRGVEFRGTFTSTLANLGSGTSVAWHNAWPPTLYHDGGSYWYDPWQWGSGGSSGGTIDFPGGSTGGGGGSTNPGSGGSSDPVGGSGDTSGGGIIWRERTTP